MKHKAVGNNVLIHLDRTREEMDGEIKYLKSGLIITTSWQRGRNSPTTGKVLSVGDIYYQQDIEGTNPQNHLDFDTENELQEGDKVIFDYREIEMCKQYGRYSVEGNSVFVFVNYSRIFVRIRDGITPINGYLLIEPLIEKKGFGAYMIDVVNETKGVIRYAGIPVRYRNDKHDEYAPVLSSESIKTGHIDLKIPDVGDTVLYKDYNSIPLQHEFGTLGKKFVRMQRRDVAAILL